PLADAAASAYPSDAKITALINDVRKREAEARTRLALDASEKRIVALLQKRPLVVGDATSIANEIETLRGANPETAIRFEKQLAEVLAGDVGNAAKLEAGSASLAAIKAAAGVLRANTSLAAIATNAESRIAELQKQRDTELAAQNGELVINALPWGIVDRVLDASRKPVDLPTERTTPIKLTLPAGSYYVTLRHPNSNKTVSAFARVAAGQRSQASGSFPTLSAEEYLKHAGL
ncbi:MAG TPA: hypothetical protein PLR28_13855, partial [Dokdonella sp.]|nr:hypothetical protein [Dokdonella sp.]